MRSGPQKLSALVLHLIEVIQKLHNNNLSWNVACTSSPTPIGGGGEVGGGGGGGGGGEQMLKG